MGKPVVALDIDGTLGPFHEWFTKFAEMWLGRSLPDACHLKPGVPFYKHLGMSKATYRQCKLAYRQGGMKRSMPVYDGAPEMTREFRRAGSQVWLCTTRPYLRLDNIDPDTRHWLRRNSIQWDGIIFGPHKYNDLLRHVPREHVVGVLDDLPEQCAAARALVLPVFIKDTNYNVGADFPRVFNFMFDPWKEKMIEEIKWRAKQ